MNGYRNASCGMFLLYLFGLVLLGYGVFNLVEKYTFDQKSLEAQGTVSDIEVIDMYNRAWVEFETAEGEDITFLDALWWNEAFQSYSVGEEVDVVYDPDNPAQTAVIDDFFQRYVAILWPSILGFIVFFIGWIMRRRLLRKAEALDKRLEQSGLR